MQEHVRLITETHPDAQEGGSGISVLNVGYGLGIVRLLSPYPPPSQADKVGRPHIPESIPKTNTSHYNRSPPPSFETPT